MIYFRCELFYSPSKFVTRAFAHFQTAIAKISSYLNVGSIHTGVAEYSNLKLTGNIIQNEIAQSLI